MALIDGFYILGAKPTVLRRFHLFEKRGASHSLCGAVSWIEVTPEREWPYPEPWICVDCLREASRRAGMAADRALLCRACLRGDHERCEWVEWGPIVDGEDGPGTDPCGCPCIDAEEDQGNPWLVA